MLAWSGGLPRVIAPPFATDERVLVAQDDLDFHPWPATPAAAMDEDGVVWEVECGSLVRTDRGTRERLTASTCPLAGSDVRDVACDRSGVLWIATNRGLNLYDRHDGWRHVTGRDGLPVTDLRRVLIRRNGDRWFATPRGALRLRDGAWSLFRGPRWLPCDDVVGLAEAGADTVAVLCASGQVVGIRSQLTTLREKADQIEASIRSRHCRLGYVADCHLPVPGDTTASVHEATDNDGLWTAIYLAAECFRYAVTGEEQAKAYARESLEAMLLLERVTGIPGFPARAVVATDEPNVTRSGGEWHPSPCGQYLWKGDTSSDELNGHYFALPIAYELVADQHERRQIREMIGRVTDHLLEHDYCLIDADGEPTRWAVFTPSLLNASPKWTLERGLNSLSMLSFLKVAHVLCGDERYDNAYRSLCRRHGYALNAIDQKVMLPGEINHSDDELAFLAYYPLLLYETDPDLLTLFRMSLERTARSELPERNPLWNTIASVGLGRDVGLSDALRTLMEMPVDRVAWPVDNTDRDDVVPAQGPDRFGNAESVAVLPYSENGMRKWNGNPYQLRRGGDGRSEDDGAAYLLPYWMARFHRVIEDDS